MPFPRGPTLETPRLYLITPPLDDAAGFAPRLEAALAAADVACVLLRTAAAGDAERKAIVRALAPLVQRRDAAALVEDDARLALQAGADGCHVTAAAALGAALAALKPERIVGAGALADRDAAMAAGEAGADYVMFGAPGSDALQAADIERIAWWAEIFNIPCVGYAPALADVGAIAAAGADFVALGDALFGDPRGPAAALEDVAARLIQTRAEA